MKSSRYRLANDWDEFCVGTKAEQQIARDGDTCHSSMSQ